MSADICRYLQISADKWLINDLSAIYQPAYNNLQHVDMTCEMQLQTEAWTHKLVTNIDELQH